MPVMSHYTYVRVQRDGGDTKFFKLIDIDTRYMILENGVNRY